MSANRIFLVCQHHASPEESLLIAERGGNDVPYEAAPFRQASRWFEKHEKCGHGRDHFALAYHRPHDWDTAPPAIDTAAGAVRLALALSDVDGNA